MGVTLSIKNASDEVVERLRQRAARNHRSLQGELMSIIEAAASETRPWTAQDVLGEVRALGVSSPSESAAILRADRDGR